MTLFHVVLATHDVTKMMTLLYKNVSSLGAASFFMDFVHEQEFLSLQIENINVLAVPRFKTNYNVSFYENSTLTKLIPGFVMFLALLAPDF